jgi:NAD(P)H-hydrate repair Nnr-like enzyme with NAD(P)H-hydrate dehydratase domain
MNKIPNKQVLDNLKKIIPKLSSNFHKGMAGRICIVGKQFFIFNEY